MNKAIYNLGREIERIRFNMHECMYVHESLAGYKALKDRLYVILDAYEIAGIISADERADLEVDCINDFLYEFDRKLEHILFGEEELFDDDYDDDDDEVELWDE